MVRLIIDTGAIQSLLSPAAAQRLRLPRDPWVGEHLIGVAGTPAFAWNAVTGEISVGGVSFPEREMAVAPLAVPADGLLGGDFWQRFDADLDIPDRRLTLFPAASCRRAIAPWGGPTVLVQGLADSPPRRLLLPASLDGKPAVALFDTGAQTSAVALRLASRFPPPQGGWRAVRLRGVNADGRVVPARRFGLLKVGDLSFADPLLPLLPFMPGEANLLAGEDLLRGCRTWFSFAARQVFVATIPGNVLPCAEAAP